MASTSARQRRTTGRVMHEFAHGELKSGPGGKGGRVKDRRQAIAIALSEAGASRDRSEGENRSTLARTKRKEARGATGQQAREGKARVGASKRRESSRAMGGKAAARTTASGHKAARTRSQRSGGGLTRLELCAKARKRGIAGRSRMSKRQLENALR